MVFFRKKQITYLDAIASPSNMLVLRMMRICIYLFENDEDDNYLFENVKVLSNTKPTYS